MARQTSATVFKITAIVLFHTSTFNVRTMPTTLSHTKFLVVQPAIMQPSHKRVVLYTQKFPDMV